MTEAELQTLISKKNQTESPKIEKVGQILFSTVICENKQQLVLLVGYNEDGFLEIRRTSEQLLMESLKSFNLQQSGYIHRDLLLEMIQDANLKSFHFSSEKPKDLCNVTYIDDYEQLKTASLNIDINGRIRLLDGNLTPLDIKFEQELTDLQIKELSYEYVKVTHELTYNNLGDFLDFINFVKLEKAKDSSVTMRDAFEKYQVNLNANFEKYRSGRCISLATKIHEIASKMGIISHVLSRKAKNAWTVIPIPGTNNNPYYWQSLSASTKGVDHCDVIVPFYNEEGLENVVKFNCSFESDEKYEDIEFFDSLARFKTSENIHGFIGLPNENLDPNFSAKQQLKSRHKLVYATHDDKIMGIDLLQGNFYLNSKWIQAIPDLPLNDNGKISISLADLDQNQKAIYYINKTPVEMTHQEALASILNKLKRNIEIPQDFQENIQSLAQMREEIINDFAIDPIPLISKYFNDLKVIGSVNLRYQKGLENNCPGLINNETAIAFSECFEKLCVSIKENDETGLQNALADINNLLPEMKILLQN